MERKLKDETSFFWSVSLYRGDLEQILDWFNGACNNVQISDDEFQYASLEEIRFEAR